MAQFRGLHGGYSSVLTWDTNDSLIRDVIMVLLPTPSGNRGRELAAGVAIEKEHTVSHQQNSHIPPHLLRSSF